MLQILPSFSEERWRKGGKGGYVAAQRTRHDVSVLYGGGKESMTSVYEPGLNERVSSCL